MKTHRKIFWENEGFARRGSSFWTITFSLGNIGVIITKPFTGNKLIEFYKLTGEQKFKVAK